MLVPLAFTCITLDVLANVELSKVSCLNVTLLVVNSAWLVTVLMSKAPLGAQYKTPLPLSTRTSPAAPLPAGNV